MKVITSDNWLILQKLPFQCKSRHLRQMENQFSYTVLLAIDERNIPSRVGKWWHSDVLPCISTWVTWLSKQEIHAPMIVTEPNKCHLVFLINFFFFTKSTFLRAYNFYSRLQPFFRDFGFFSRLQLFPMTSTSRHDFNFPVRHKHSTTTLISRNYFLWSVIQQYLQMFTLGLKVTLSKFYGQ